MDILHSWMQHSYKKFKDETLDLNELDGFSPEAAPAIPSGLQKGSALLQSLTTALLIWSTEQRKWLERLFSQFSSRLYIRSATVDAPEKLTSHTQQVPTASGFLSPFSCGNLVMEAPPAQKSCSTGELGEHWVLKNIWDEGSNLHFRQIILI